MWRYLTIATAIVAAALAAILALPDRRDGRDPSIAYTSGRGTPGPAQRDEFRQLPAPVTGDAPWALSALPECFRQLSSASGPAGFARAKIPRAAHRIGPGVRVHVADCTLDVGVDSALVTRGENRLRIPPPARLYVAGDRLVLDRSDGPREDVRIYALARKP